MSTTSTNPTGQQVPEGTQPLDATSLRQLLDATSTIVVVKDIQGRYVHVNRAFLLLMGGCEGDYLGRSDRQIFDPELAAQLQANDQKVLTERRELVFEEVIELGQRKYVYSARKYPLLTEDGTPWAVCLIAEDVTDARRTDQALRDSEQSYRTIFEASEDCIFLHDFDTGAFVDVNPRACEVYGYDHTTMLRMRPGDLSTGEAPYTEDDALRHIQRARSGEIVRFEWHRRNADGSASWDEVCLKHVKLAGVDRILAVTRDVTERKEREQALARSEDRLRATVEAALDCIVIMDSGGRIREFNPAAEACFGYRREAVLGRPLADLIIPARMRTAHHQGMERYLRSGDARMLGRRVDLTAMRADGSEFPVELAIAEAQGVDGVVFIGYLRDITPQREAEHARTQLEAQLRQAQKMEAIGHLTGGIAHDFNNILTGIMGYLGMAEDLARGQDDTRLRTFLERARHAGRRASELIQQMLTFSRGQRGDPRVLAPAALVDDALRLVRASLPATLELDVDLCPETPAVVFDPVQFEQVLMNLCINARDAMAGHGTIEVRLRGVDACSEVCTSCQHPVRGRLVELTVADTGPGVAPALLHRMFEPFFTTKAPGQGSGMGLATVHGIVHEHGGHVLVGNRAQGGACFRVLLPVEEVTPSSETARQPGPSMRPGPAVLTGRVLLVEDDPAVRGFMSELLREWGLMVSAFGDPVLAAAAVGSDGAGFQFAILDYTMPHMTGLDLAAHLRAASPTLPIVLYSGYAEGLDKTDLAAAGIRALLGKPLDTAQLFRYLEAELAGNRITTHPDGGRSRP